MFDGISVTPSFALWRVERGAFALLSDNANNASLRDLNGEAYVNSGLAKGGQLCSREGELCPSVAVFWEERSFALSSVDSACAPSVAVAEAKESAVTDPPGRCCVRGSPLSSIKYARDEDSMPVCAFLRGTGGYLPPKVSVMDWGGGSVGRRGRYL